MTVRVWHLLVPVCLTVAIFNWGLAFWIYLVCWWAAHLAFGGLRAPLFDDYGVEPPASYYDDTTHEQEESW